MRNLLTCLTAGAMAASIALPARCQPVMSPPAASNSKALPAGAAMPTDDTLYQALGGQPGLVALMDDFVPRLVADPRIGAFFKETKQSHLKQSLVDQFCVVAGGPCTYDGDDMQAAHSEMHIRKADFHALVEVLQVSMDRVGIAFATQNRLLARLAPMHREVINTR